MKILNSVIDPTLTYGAEVVQPNGTDLRKLEAIRNSGMRMILRCPHFTPIAAMTRDLGTAESQPTTTKAN